MARTQNTAAASVASTELTREQLGQQIANEILSGLSRKQTGLTFTDRLLQYGSNKIADAGNGIAELSAGFTAAADNFSIARESAIVRQKRRTAEKLAALVELELQARGV